MNKGWFKYVGTSSSAIVSAPDTANPCLSFKSPLTAVRYPTVRFIFCVCDGVSMAARITSGTTTRHKLPGLIASGLASSVTKDTQKVVIIFTRGA